MVQSVYLYKYFENEKVSTWDGVRADLRRGLRDAQEALALAERLNESTSANPRATADHRQSAAFDLKRAV